MGNDNNFTLLQRESLNKKKQKHQNNLHYRHNVASNYQQGQPVQTRYRVDLGKVERARQPRRQKYKKEVYGTRSRQTAQHRCKQNALWELPMPFETSQTSCLTRVIGVLVVVLQAPTGDALRRRNMAITIGDSMARWPPPRRLPFFSTAPAPFHNFSCPFFFLSVLSFASYPPLRPSIPKQ